MWMSEQTGHPATFVPAQPAVLVLGDRRIAIDEWPLARSVQERRSVEVNRPSDDVLLIEPMKRTGAGMILQSTLVFLGGALPTTIAAALEVPMWLSVLLGLLILSALLMLVRSQLSSLRWIRIDRQAGKLVIERKVGFRRQPRTERTCPLTAIQAVQLLYSGRHSVTEPQGAGEQQTTSYREFCGYELNLVLDDPQMPRLNLFSLSDWQWIRETGQLMGDFLAVPVIDKLHHGG
jgi:hypothetical protein